jgi:hypothetical protein
VMTAINAKSDLRDLSSEDLDAVSGGWFSVLAFLPKAETGTTAGQNDPHQMFQQIMLQMTQGG